MVRLFGPLAGLFFVVALLWSLVVGVIAVAPVLGEFGHFTEPTVEHEFYKYPKELDLASDGPTGHFDNQQLQRGFRSTRKSVRPAIRCATWRSAISPRSATTRPR